MRKFLSVAMAGFVLGTATLTGCSDTSLSNPESTRQSRLPVTVSIAPQKYFVEQIGGDNVEVDVMIQPGVDPHTYEPKPEQLKTLAKTKAYFSVGISFEDAWKDRLKAVNSKMLVIDTSQGVDKLPLEEHKHHHTETEQSHEEETLDPHIWLSPKRVKTQAQTIYKTLVQLDPQNQAEYKANYERFLQEINTLDADIRQTLSGVKNRKFMVFHPEWGYFAQDYGLEMIAIEVEGNEPSASELSNLITEAKEENIKIIFAQPEFSTKSAETIAQEIKGEVIIISAFAQDWSNNLREVSDKMAEAL